MEEVFVRRDNDRLPPSTALPLTLAIALGLWYVIARLVMEVFR